MQKTVPEDALCCSKRGVNVQSGVKNAQLLSEMSLETTKIKQLRLFQKRWTFFCQSFESFCIKIHTNS